MNKPTNTEIRERHDSVGHTDFVDNKNTSGYKAHHDRGILLDRLEAAKQEIKNTEHDIDQYMEINLELLNDEIPALQAKIDMLMLEYCPEEMPKEQKAEWAANQIVAGPDVEAVIDKALK